LHSTNAPDATATEHNSFSAVVATFTDDNSFGQAGDFTATIDWGDGNSSSGTVDANAGGGFKVTGTHTYANDGHYAIAVQIVDDGSSTATANISADVADLPPVVTANDIAPVEGTAFSGKVASFTDDDAGVGPADYVVTIDWGDGNTDNG